MSNLRTICKCGHDKATHHEGKYNCLGVYCNDCKKYVNEWDEGPKTPSLKELQDQLKEQLEEDVRHVPWSFPKLFP